MFDILSICQYKSDKLNSKCTMYIIHHIIVSASELRMPYLRSVCLNCIPCTHKFIYHELCERKTLI